MTEQRRMDEDRKRITQRILDLTLEIIYLLTGEDYTVVKKISTDHVEPCNQLSESCHLNQNPIRGQFYCLIPEKNKKRKILEATNKIIELLTGEEWEYLKGHKDLYKDVMMENRLPLTSPDGSRNRNTPERCPRPLYSRDSTQEHQEIPQTRSLYSRDSTQEHHEIPQARPLYSRDSTQEHHEILQDEEDEDGINIIVKVEADAEGSYVRGDEPCKEEEILPEISTDPGDTRDQTDVRFEDEEIRQVKIKEEDIPVEINTDGQYRRYDKTRHLHIAPVGEIDDNITSSPHEENSSSPNLYPTPHSAHPLPNPLRNGRRFPNHPHSINHHTPHEEDEIFQHSENGGTLTQGVKPILPYACSECGKGFFTKYKLAVRQRIHTTERPYSCSECGKCFTWKEVLVRHQRVHAGEKPFACTECGKCFAQLSHLTCHRRTHTGVKPYSCTECGKCFTRRSSLTAHGRIHRGERPYAHSQCEKCCPGKH